MRPDPVQVPVGNLRWPVQIAKREQVQSSADTATIIESLTDAFTCRAEVEPIGAMTFIAGQQTDRPITHRITIRWLDWLDQTHVIVRQSKRGDGSQRIEMFRIRRVGELNGRKRFLTIEAELESRA